MLAALAGGEALEIVVLLKDLSEAGLKKMEGNVAHAERSVNSTNFGGFHKASSGLKADAEAAAGKRGGGGLGALFTAFGGLPAAVGAAGLAIAGFAALTEATLPVYEKVWSQERSLDAAYKAHGTSLANNRTALEEAIKTGEEYGRSADDTRAAVLKLVEAGVSQKDVTASLPAVFDLMIAKHITAEEAATAMAKAMMGSGRALLDLGVKLPKVTTAAQDTAAGEKQLAKASKDVQTTHQHLKDVEHELAGKHKLTAAEAIKLRDAHRKAREAAHHLKQVQAALNTVTDDATRKSKNLKVAADAVTGATGDQKDSVNELAKKTATLGDKWEVFTTKIGPGLETMIGGVVDSLSTLIDMVNVLTGNLDKTPHGHRTLNHLGQPVPNPVHSSPKPSNNLRGYAAGHAAGGWVGLRGAELSWLGEKGPEFVTSTGHLPQGGGGGIHLHINTIWPPTPRQIREMADALDHHEYWRGVGQGSSGNRT